MTPGSHSDGIVYTETVVFSPPEQYAADAPYQIAIVALEDNPTRITVRIVAPGENERVRIGDKVTFAEERDGVMFYRKAD